jgi:hypothetical protein
VSKDTREAVAGNSTLPRHVSKDSKGAEQTALQIWGHYGHTEGLTLRLLFPPRGPSGEGHTGQASHSVCLVHPLETVVNAVCNKDKI